jgi:hypothetical protein
MSVERTVWRIMLVLAGVVVIGLIYWVWPEPLLPEPPLPAPAPSQPPFRQSEGGMRTELSAVVEGQLAAFRTNDFARAYGFASSGIHKIYSETAFTAMVKKDYEVFAQMEEAHILDVQDDGEHGIVEISVKGRNQESREYRYLLGREKMDWKVEGVSEIVRPREAEGKSRI